MKMDDLIEMFNNGDLDVKTWFNDYDTWFNILKKRGLMSEIDPHNASDSEEWQNEFLLWLYENDKEKYYHWVEKSLGDIQIDPATKKVYWVGNREDLSDLFCGGNRQDLSPNTISNILSVEGDWWELHSETTDNVYRDVIDELDRKNIDRLMERIIFDLKDIEVSTETELLELIAQEQNHPDYVIVNQENVSRIVDDEETMNYLLRNDLVDLNTELFSVHSNAYNSAHQDEVYESIWKELSDYFDGPGEWVSVPHPYKKETKIEKSKIPINNFEGEINDYLSYNKNYGNRGTLEYQGDFLGVLKENRDCLSVSVPDYPDFRKVDKLINEFFRDYI
jgi:hypothetical protein